MNRLSLAPPPARRRLASGLLLALLFLAWSPAAAQRVRRQPARPAGPTAAPTPDTAAQAAPRPLAEYFPANALVYFEVERITNAIDEVLASDNLKSFLSAADSPLPIDVTRYDEALVAFGLPDKATIAGTRLGIGLVFTPGKKAEFQGLPALPEPEFLAVIIAPDEAAATRFAEIGNQWLPTLAASPKRSKPVAGRVGRFRTTLFPGRKANESITMARSGQVIAVGLSPVMTRWLTQFAQPTFASLGKSKDFEEAQKQLSAPRNGLIYINTTTTGEYARQILADILKPGRADGKPVSREQAQADAELVAKTNQLLELSGIGSVGGLAYAYGVEQGRVTQRIVIGIDRAGAGLYPAFADGPRVSGRAADFLPDNTQAFATMSVNPTRVYDTLRQMAGIFNPKYETDLQAAERKLGVNFRQEISAALTGEITLAVGDIQPADIASSSAPLPTTSHVAAFAVSNNPQALRDAFAKVFSFAARRAADRRAWQATVKPAEGAEAPPPGAIFEPRAKTHEGETVWLFAGDNNDEEDAFAVSVVANVLVAGRASDVKWVIDNYRRGQTLGRREDFNVGFGARPADAMGSAYVSQAFLAQALDELRKETPKRYQPFLEGLTPVPLFTHIGREGRIVNSVFELPLSFLVGLAGAGYGASAAYDERRANEAAARGALRAIYEAQMDYARGAGKGAYSDSLPTLAKRADGSRAFAEEIELMSRLPYQGYALGPITLRPASGDKPAGFSLTAFPVAREGADRTGDRTFYLDETGVLRCRETATENADAEAPACESFAPEKDLSLPFQRQ